MRLNLEETPKIAKVVVYGGPGSGKTHFITTFPEPIGVINTSPSNIETLRKFAKSHDIRVEDFSQQYSGGKIYNELIKFTNDVLLGRKFASCATIAIDDYSGLMDIFMEMSLEKATYKGGKKIQPGALGEPNQSHYHAEGVKCIETVNKVLKLQKHVIITTHERIDCDDNGTVLSVNPFTRGPTRGVVLTRKVSELYRLKTRRDVVDKKVRTVRLLQFKQGTRSAAKSSLIDQELSGDLVEPNMTKILSGEADV